MQKEGGRGENKTKQKDQSQSNLALQLFPREKILLKDRLHIINTAVRITL